MGSTERASMQIVSSPALLRLMQVPDKISVAHRVQCGGKKKVPNEGPRGAA